MNGDSLRTRARRITRGLAQLYPDARCSLDFSDSLQLLVATILSAQCTDVRVNQVTPHLFAKADQPASMAELDVSEIETIIRPCGLAPKKAQSIHELSRIIAEKHGGQVPDSFEALEALPGVGHKTASVVMSQAFGVPAFPVDTHIHRLAWRWGLSNGKNVEQTERDLKSLFPEDKWNALHLQIIYFGRELCPARGHNPYACPICSKFGRKELFEEFDLQKTGKKNQKG